jgi:allantoicase
MLVDLASVKWGGRSLSHSNAHYGEPNNMLREGRGVNMGDGWETARNPNRPEVFVEKDGVLEMPGWDWCILKLGAVGSVVKYALILT